MSTAGFVVDFFAAAPEACASGLGVLEFTAGAQVIRRFICAGDLRKRIHRGDIAAQKTGLRCWRRAAPMAKHARLAPRTPKPLKTRFIRGQNSTQMLMTGESRATENGTSDARDACNSRTVKNAGGPKGPPVCFQAASGERPLWVTSGHPDKSAPCPLCYQKPIFVSALSMSALCH